MIDGLVKAKSEVTERRKVARVLAKLAPDYKAALEEALADPLMPHEGITKALKSSGHDVSSTSVRRYRVDVLGVDFDN